MKGGKQRNGRRRFIIAINAILSYVFGVNRFRILFFFFFALACWSCGESKDYTPTESDRRVIRAYASLALLYDAFPSTNSKDSLRIYQQKADSVLTQFGFSRDEFRREFENLVNTPDHFQPLFMELSAEIRKEMQKR